MKNHSSQWSRERISKSLISRHGITFQQYKAIHFWIRYHFGPAKKCEGKSCKGVSKKYQWALVKGKRYERKRENFIELCRSCHCKEDFTEEGREHMRKVAKANMTEARKITLAQARVQALKTMEKQEKAWKKYLKELGQEAKKQL